MDIEAAVDARFNELQIERRENGRSLGWPTSNAVSLYTAEPDGIDGRLTLRDAITAFAGTVACSGIGFAGGLSSLGLGQDLGFAMSVWGVSTGAGAGLSFLRVSLDILNPFRAWVGLMDYLGTQHSGEWSDFLAWRLEQEYGEAPLTEHTFSIIVHTDDSDKIMSLDKWETKRAREFAQIYQRVASTAEIHYVGAGLPWSRGKTSRAAWKKFRAEMIRCELAIDTGNEKWELTPEGEGAVGEWAAAKVD